MYNAILHSKYAHFSLSLSLTSIVVLLFYSFLCLPFRRFDSFGFGLVWSFPLPLPLSTHSQFSCFISLFPFKYRLTIWKCVVNRASVFDRSSIRLSVLQKRSILCFQSLSPGPVYLSLWVCVVCLCNGTFLLRLFNFCILLCYFSLRFFSFYFSQFNIFRLQWCVSIQSLFCHLLWTCAKHNSSRSRQSHRPNDISMAEFDDGKQSEGKNRA